MMTILAINCAAIAFAVLTPNEVLRWHSYAFYGVQLLTLLPYLARRATLASNLFLPSLFVVAYYLVNLTLGGYLVPREYGWAKDFAQAAQTIEHYGVIVPYLMLVNVALFVVSCHSLGVLSRIEQRPTADAPSRRFEALVAGRVAQVACIGAFVAITVGKVFSAFSFQFVLLVMHLDLVARRRTLGRFVIYGLYLAIMLSFGFGNKREIAIVLFLILFLDAYHGGYRLRFGISHIVSYAGAAASFILLILTASVLRGYGDFAGGSMLAAAAYIPRYVGSGVFMDGITDNLELASNYGSSVAAIDLTIRGEIPLQYGATVWKLFFLPVPRSHFPAKPESAMQIFTDNFAWPSLWADSGSLPVPFSAEMFMNFGVFGVVPFVLIFLAIDRVFVEIHRSTPRSLGYYSCIFVALSVLLFARGSGVEQYVLYYLFALPIIAAVVLVGHREGGRRLEAA